MKIAVIGGGSTYTPELVAGLLARSRELPLETLALMDPDRARLQVVAGFARRLCLAQDASFEIVEHRDLREAVAGAAYVIVQLRVGQMAARRGDEYLGQRHQLIGQETTGIGGLAKALRTVPVVLEIARVIRELAPAAWLVNFTNPAGLVTEALARHAPEVASVGLCNSAITTSMALLAQAEQLLGAPIDPRDAHLDTLGLNHLTWHRGFTVGDQELWPRLFARFLDRLREQEDPRWDIAQVQRLGMIPNSYLQYYYATDRKLAEQSRWPPSRAEEVMEIEQALLREYADPALVTVPDRLMQRGGAWYSTLAAELMCAHHNDLGAVHVVNVPHRGAVPGWDADWVLEMPARVSRKGVEPLPATPLPTECYQLLARVKHCELLTVDAALSGDRSLLREALATHPLGPGIDRVDVVMDDLIATNHHWLPRFAHRVD